MARRRARRTSPLFLPSAFQLFTPSKDIVLKNIGVFAILYLLPFIYLLDRWLTVQSSTTKNLHYASDFNGFPLYGNIASISLLAIVGLTLSIIVQIMTNQAELDGAQGKHITMDNLWKTIKRLGWRMLGLYIVMAVVIIVGFLLLIVPGFFMIRRYLLAPYVMLDKKCGIKEALDQSARLSLINTGSVWGIMGVMFLIGLLGVIPLLGGLLSFAVGMLYSVAPALRYEQLKKLA